MTNATTVPVDGYQPLRPGDCQIIAEAGANHANSVAEAIRMSKAAADAGAWAIKFQLYKADRLTAKESPKYWDDPFGTATQREAFELSDHMDYDAWSEVTDACGELGIIFFATPFDLDAVDALERLDVPLYKIASADITHKRLLQRVGATGKPLLLSTGASTEDEIERAIEWTGLGPDRLVLLSCTLTYPTPDEDGNFARIETMRQRFSPYLIGASDHTLGPEGAWMAAAVGAVCIEKHYTLDPGAPDIPDHAMSVTPEQLRLMVEAGHRGGLLRGSGQIGVLPSEEPARRLARRSVVSTRPIPAGTAITLEMVEERRPATGIPAWQLEEVVGRKAAVDIPGDTVVAEDHLA